MHDELQLLPPTVAILAPMTSTSRSFAGPRLLSAQLQGCLLCVNRPVHLNSVVGELVGLVPALRRAHVALQT